MSTFHTLFSQDIGRLNWRTVLDSFFSAFNQFRTISFIDILDILIVAYIIYRVMKLLKDTSAERLIKGIIILVGIMLLASMLHLTMISWLLQQALNVGLFAIVVVFQPELRRLLEQIGKGNFSRLIVPADAPDEVESMITATVSACADMSRTKTGALIVLERNTNLSEIVRTGTPVNSAVNLEVLGTIFYEGTPLHDGAAIIEDGRIKAAGCVLPLSNNLDLGKDMGTRHRACLGIAENSDAIAIVVSEETGIISMAKNGVLMRHFDRQTLYTRLVDEMIPKETASEKSAAEGWKARGKRLLNWVNNKEEDEQQ